MTYKLGVDVGGTFTDALLVNRESRETYTAKVPSTPEDSSIGVINSIARVCKIAGIEANAFYRMHVQHRSQTRPMPARHIEHFVAGREGEPLRHAQRQIHTTRMERVPQEVAYVGTIVKRRTTRRIVARAAPKGISMRGLGAAWPEAGDFLPLYRRLTGRPVQRGVKPVGKFFRFEGDARVHQPS